MGILRGPLVRIRSTSLIWCLCGWIMSRRAHGKRSFSSSDLGYEKATINFFLAFSLTRLYSSNMIDELLWFICCFSSYFFLHCSILLSLVCLALFLCFTCAYGIVTTRELLIVRRVVSTHEYCSKIGLL